MQSDAEIGSKVTEFRIGETNFGVDLLKSTLVLEVVDGSGILTAEIHGDEKQYESITEGEGSKWAWTLYPPHFYLREFPVKFDVPGRCSKVMASTGDLEEYDAAIYLMDHNDLDDIVMRVDSCRSIEISGNVSILGRARSFEINWNCE